MTHEVQEGITVAEAGGPLETYPRLCPKEGRMPGHHDKFIKVKDFNTTTLGKLHDGYPVSPELAVK